MRYRSEGTREVYRETRPDSQTVLDPLDPFVVPTQVDLPSRSRVLSPNALSLHHTLLPTLIDHLDCYHSAVSRRFTDSGTSSKLIRPVGREDQRRRDGTLFLKSQSKYPGSSRKLTIIFLCNLQESIYDTVVFVLHHPVPPILSFLRQVFVLKYLIQTRRSYLLRAFWDSGKLDSVFWSSFFVGSLTHPPLILRREPTRQDSTNTPSTDRHTR